MLTNQTKNDTNISSYKRYNYNTVNYLDVRQLNCCQLQIVDMCDAAGKRRTP